MQSLALPLVEDMLVQAATDYGVQPAWQMMWGGLRLWQLWDLDLPLAAWQNEVARWLLAEPMQEYGVYPQLPGHYTELCAQHRLWMASPAEIGIPLLCQVSRSGNEDWLMSAYVPSRAPMYLPARYPPEYDRMMTDIYGYNHLDEAVAVETLIEYAVTTYGRAQLPALVAGLGQYTSWDTLIPAVYGVPVVEFQAGWQAYVTPRTALALDDPIEKNIPAAYNRSIELSVVSTRQRGRPACPQAQ